MTGPSWSSSLLRARGDDSTPCFLALSSPGASTALRRAISGYGNGSGVSPGYFSAFSEVNSMESLTTAPLGLARTSAQHFLTATEKSHESVGLSSHSQHHRQHLCLPEILWCQHKACCTSYS